MQARPLNLSCGAGIITTAAIILTCSTVAGSAQQNLDDAQQNLDAPRSSAQVRPQQLPPRWPAGPGMMGPGGMMSPFFMRMMFALMDTDANFQKAPVLTVPVRERTFVGDCRACVSHDCLAPTAERRNASEPLHKLRRPPSAPRLNAKPPLRAGKLSKSGMPSGRRARVCTANTLPSMGVPATELDTDSPLLLAEALHPTVSRLPRRCQSEQRRGDLGNVNSELHQ